MDFGCRVSCCVRKLKSLTCRPGILGASRPSSSCAAAMEPASLSHHFCVHLGFSYDSVVFPWAGNPSVHIPPLGSRSLSRSFGECASGFLSFPTSPVGFVFCFWLQVPHLTTAPTLWLAGIIHSVPPIPLCVRQETSRVFS